MFAARTLRSVPVANAARSLRTYATEATKDGYKVVIIGGGAAGVTVAAKLAQTPFFHNTRDIAIVEPSAEHFYQPLWTLVGGGIKPFSESAKATREVIPQGAEWLKARVSKVDPVKQTVATDDGKTVKYDFLVVAPGISLDWDKIPGLVSTLGKDGVTSIYSAQAVQGAYDMIRSFQGGNAIFTQPATPIKCAGAPQKIAYLAEELFRSNGVRDKATVKFNTGMGKIFSADYFGEALTKIAESRGIEVNLGTNLLAIKPESKEAVFKKGTQEIVEKYSLLHVVPPMSAPKFIGESGLGNADGWCNVDKFTMQHVKYPNVFSLGDASSLPTSKTAAAISAQSKFLVNNLVAVIGGETVLNGKYDGYTACPLVTGKNKLIMAEFSGYDFEPLETFPYDQRTESAFGYTLKTEVFPWLYWDAMLKGSWSGPRTIRNAVQGVIKGEPIYAPYDQFYPGKLEHKHHH
ncbi:hypothetical protein HDU93_008703 [Gonapodya sp. JEL0774]|nr:hypothetical protein HDU93_008703 [Gonapodya sp. JEL0774]